MESVRKLFPRCCSARWGSVDGTEQRIWLAGCGRLLAVLLDILKVQSKSTSSNKAAVARAKVTSGKAVKANDAPADLNPDSLAVEAIKEYQIKLSKWRERTMKVLRDALFSAVIRVMNCTRSPLGHLSNLLKTAF